MPRLFIEGRGPVVLLIHGGPGLGSETVRPISTLLRKRHTVVRYERECAEMGSSVIEVEMARRRLGVRRLSIIAHSWGAGIASLYAATHPSRVHSLVLAHPLEISSEFCAYAERKLEIRRILTGYPRPRRDIEACSLELRLATAQWASGRNFPAPSVGDCNPRAAQAAWASLEKLCPGQNGSGYDLSTAVQKIRCRPLILSGDHDVIDSRSDADFARLTGGRLIHFRKSGHWSFLEEPSKFQSVVLAAVAERFQKQAIAVGAKSDQAIGVGA